MIKLIELNDENYSEYKEYINSNNIKEKLSCKKENIPSTLFLVVRNSDEKIIGSLKINHYLDEELYNNEGHLKIYLNAIKISGEEYIELIKLALIECKKYDIGRAYIYCNKNDDLLITAIEENGGKLIDTEKNKTVKQKYRISLKKRYANRHKVKMIDSDLIYMIESFKEENYDIDVSFCDFNNANIKMVTPKGKTTIGKHFKVLGFYNYNSKVKLSAFYNDKNEIIEWYFDIAIEIGKENGVPYEDDLYLDIVVDIDGTISLLDEDELKCALDRYEITEEEYKMAHEEADNLIKRLTGNKEKLKSITDKYLEYYMKKCI